MEDIVSYIRGFAEAFIIVCTPLAYKLYKELTRLRKEVGELREKLAYLKGKYKEKVVFKTHGKKPKDLDDE